MPEVKELRRFVFGRVRTGEPFSPGDALVVAVGADRPALVAADPSTVLPATGTWQLPPLPHHERNYLTLSGRVRV